MESSWRENGQWLKKKKKLFLEGRGESSLFVPGEFKSKPSL